MAITGIGVISSRAAPARTRSGTGLHGPAPEGERRVPDFDPEQWFTTKEARNVDRFAQFSVAVADMALADAGELDADPGRSGVIMGTGVGGLQTLETQILVYAEKGARRVSPRLVPMMMSNAGAAAVSMRLGWHGPVRDGHHRLRGRRPLHRPRRPARRLAAAATWPSAGPPRRA